MTDIGGPEVKFQPTLWTVVRRATDPTHPDARQAMAALIQQYWKPVYYFIRSRGQSAEDAKDLTQAFFCQVLERRALGQADPGKGRFRSYLLGYLTFFLSNQAAAARALKRGGGTAPLSLEFATAEESYRSGESPERLYLRTWATTVIQQALTRLEQELARADKSIYFDVLSQTLSPEQPTYKQIAARLGIGEGDVSNYLHRARKRYRAALIATVMPSVSSPEDAELEIQALLDALE